MKRTCPSSILAIRSSSLMLRLFVATSLTCSIACAAEPQSSPQVWLNPGVFSRHFDRSKDFREDNIGFGADVVLAPDHALMAGTFINSERTRTHYGAYQWRPLHWQPADMNVSAGVAVGAFDGYPRYRDGAAFAAVVPVLAIEGRRLGANLSAVPTLRNRVNGAIVLQLKLRVW